MAMSRKHYREIAEILARASRAAQSAETDGVRANDIVNRLVIEMAEFLKRDNYNFDYARFYDAVK